MTFDPLNLPSYNIPEVADYLNLHPETLRTWVKGRHYPTKQGQRYSKPLIRLTDPEGRLMSFANLVEAHVLSAIRRREEIRMDKIRAALDYLEKQLQSEHPLVERQFLTDGKELFIHELGQIINLNRKGQRVIEDALAIYLKRIDYDKATGRPFRLYPMGQVEIPDARPVMIDPRIGFGRLVITGTGIPVDVLTSRYNAGDTLEDLAEDYNCEKNRIEKAIFWKTAA